MAKKILVGAMLLLGLCSIVAFAEEIADWSVGTATAKIETDGTSATLTVDKIVSATAVTVEGKKPVVSTSSTVTSMVESGTKAATGATVTQAFATVYSSAPIVLYRYTGADMPATNPVTITVSNFIVTAAQTNLQWFAIGAK